MKKGQTSFERKVVSQNSNFTNQEIEADERRAWKEISENFTGQAYERRVSLLKARKFISRIRKQKAQNEGKLMMRKQKQQLEKQKKLQEMEGQEKEKRQLLQLRKQSVALQKILMNQFKQQCRMIRRRTEQLKTGKSESISSKNEKDSSNEVSKRKEFESTKGETKKQANLDGDKGNQSYKQRNRVFAKKFKTDPVEVASLAKSQITKLPALPKRREYKPTWIDKDPKEYLDPLDRKKIDEIGKKIQKLSRLSTQQ